VSAYVLLFFPSGTAAQSAPGIETRLGPATIPLRTVEDEEDMKRTHLPGIIDVVFSDDSSEIEGLARDTRLDRAYADHSLLTNRQVLERVQNTLQIGGEPFPTVAARCAQGRAEAQTALWQRLSSLAPALADGPAEVESLAAFVRGQGDPDGCGILVQQVVGRIFVPGFTATPESWNAALVLNEALRTINLAELALWSITDKVDKAKQLLAGLVQGDLAGVHAIGIAVHNIVSGINLMRGLYSDPSNRKTLTAETAATRCIVAPASILRQPTATTPSAEGDLATSTLIVFNLQDANAKAPNADLAFLRGTWSRCPAEQWAPALLTGIWSRACNSEPENSPSSPSRQSAG
jgi:hypothetical protein